MSIGFAYLARSTEPSSKIEKFIASYKQYAAGVDHDLIVIYKGGAVHQQLFEGIAHQPFFISDEGLDITAYMKLAKESKHRLLCFSNSNTTLLSQGWLKKLADGLSENRVGLVGATGSFESLATSFELLSKVGWLAKRARIPFDPDIAEHYRWILKVNAPAWLEGETRPNFGSIFGALAPLETRWSRRWARHLRRRSPFLNDHNRFPNPHVRSNMFMIERERLLALRMPNVKTKPDAYAFESGKSSLSNRILAAGLELAVIDADGRVVRPDQWKDSNIYRSGNQGLLLASDNQCESYLKASEAERNTLTMMSWGQSSVRGNIPPNLGLLELTL